MDIIEDFSNVFLLAGFSVFGLFLHSDVFAATEAPTEVLSYPLLSLATKIFYSLGALTATIYGGLKSYSLYIDIQIKKNNLK